MAYDGGKSGIADYIDNVSKGLSCKNTVDMIVLKSDAARFSSGGMNIITVPDILGRPLLNMFWHLFVLPIIIKQKKYDMIFLPAANRRVLAFYPYFTLSTVHDLSQFNVKGKYDIFRTVYIQKILPFFLKRSDRFIAVSGCTKNDMVKYLKINEDKIEVLYNGYKSAFSIIGNGTPSGFRKKYILYVARIEHPGKNHLNLIKAYENSGDDIRNNYDLVLAGPMKERSDEVTGYAASSKVKNNIHFTGFVDESDLPSLYRNASIFVFPSLYEGFGIPVLEAMASGVPVALSNRGSLPEVGGDAALYFDPEDVVSIRNSIEMILRDEKLSFDLVKKGKIQTGKFSWDRHCEGIIELFERFYGKD